MENNDLGSPLSGIQEILLRGVSLQQRLLLSYHGEERLVEVHAVGTSTKGNPVARVYQVVGGAVFGNKTGWKMLSLSDIEDISFVDQYFTEPREGYQKGDRGMSSIVLEV